MLRLSALYLYHFASSVFKAAAILVQWWGKCLPRKRVSSSDSYTMDRGGCGIGDVSTKAALILRRELEDSRARNSTASTAMSYQSQPARTPETSGENSNANIENSKPDVERKSGQGGWGRNIVEHNHIHHLYLRATRPIFPTGCSDIMQLPHSDEA